MSELSFIYACFISSVGFVLFFFIFRASLLLWFSLKYDYAVSWIMLFFKFPRYDVKNTFHPRVKYLKLLYNKTTPPFLIFCAIIVTLKFLLSLAAKAISDNLSSF